MPNKKTRYDNVIETPGSQSAAPRRETGMQELLHALWQIVDAHPDVSSYAYIRAIHEFFFPLEQNSLVRKRLWELLRTDVRWNDSGAAVGFDKEETAPLDFTIYYCLALYCKRKDKATHVTPSLDTLIQHYDVLFSRFPLSLEVRSWYARRTERLDDAYRCDRQLIEKLSIDTNAGVYNSFASSICSRLEKEFTSQRSGNSIFFWARHADRIRDWNLALSYMPRVIENWKKVWEDEDGYGKHYFILGKLLLFSPDLGDLSPEERRARFDEAKENFRIARACENSDEPDYLKRCGEYERYLNDCDRYAAEWQQQPAPAPAPQPTAVGMTVANTRQEITKPNEDAYVLDQDNGIFLVADGVTRPHEEYVPGCESLATDCARNLCLCIHDHLLHTTQTDPARALVDAMLAGNQAIRPLRFYQRSKFMPCATFLGAVLKEDKLYFSSCCDTVGFLIRDNMKIQLTEHYNHLAELLGYPKDRIYAELHNNINEPAGFGIFNGDERLKDFLHVSQITLQPGDRVILASDGLSKYLHAVWASRLRQVSLEQMFADSLAYDQPPYQKYADDKTCIIIDV